jgi:hypothetical protein
MKLLGIIGVGFGITDQVLIAFIKAVSSALKFDEVSTDFCR